MANSRALMLLKKSTILDWFEKAYLSNIFIDNKWNSGLIGLQISLAVILLAGDIIFSRLGITPPGIYNVFKSNKLVFGLGIFLGGNFLKSFITKTRAFEIFINNALVSSAIKSKAIMPIEDIINEVLKRAA